MKRPIACSLLPIALILTGCGWGGSDKGQGTATAQGEVLPGSVSDAMIPIDQVKSQAPLAPKAEGGEKSDGKPAAKDKPKAASAAAPVEPKPADEPAAQE